MSLLLWPYPFLPHLLNHPLRNLEPFHTSRHYTISAQLPQVIISSPALRPKSPKTVILTSTIYARLQYRLPDLDLARPIVNRPAHVHPKLITPIQRTQHRAVQQRAGLALETWPRPDAAPAGFCHEFLHWAGEAVGFRQLSCSCMHPLRSLQRVNLR